MRGGQKHQFRLQLKSSEILELAGEPDKDEKEAFAAGQAIAAGEQTRENLKVIFRWKTRGRGISRLDANTDEEIGEALAVATNAQNTRTAISVLCGLRGVNVPVASAIITCINPKRYTIIDFRALEALNYNGFYQSIDFYLDYLDFCRKLADVNTASMRQLDRAMWNWSKSRRRS